MSFFFTVYYYVLGIVEAKMCVILDPLPANRGSKIN